jgi:hypothetical protein
MRISRDRHPNDLRLAVAQRHKLNSLQDLAIYIGPRRPRLPRLAQAEFDALKAKLLA